MTHSETARRGMQLAEFGMVTAVIGKLLQREIISYEWIIAGLLLGYRLAWRWLLGADDRDAPADRTLTRIRRFGLIAGGPSEYCLHGAKLGELRMGAIGFEVLLGSLTTIGNLVAFENCRALFQAPL